MQKKFRGSLLGIAIGDALGYLVKKQVRIGDAELERLLGNSTRLPLTENVQKVMDVAESLVIDGVAGGVDRMIQVSQGIGTQAPTAIFPDAGQVPGTEVICRCRSGLDLEGGAGGRLSSPATTGPDAYTRNRW